MALHGPDLPIRCNPPPSPSVTQRARCTLPPPHFSLVATAATTTTGRPSLPRYSPGSQVFFGLFAVGEHHQVRACLLGLLFVLRESEHPNPNLLSVFGSDLTTKCICMY